MEHKIGNNEAQNKNLSSEGQYLTLHKKVVWSPRESGS